MSPYALFQQPPKIFTDHNNHEAQGKIEFEIAIFVSKQGLTDHFSFLAKTSPLNSLPAVTTKPAPTWDAVQCNNSKITTASGTEKRGKERI